MKKNGQKFLQSEVNDISESNIHTISLSFNTRFIRLMIEMIIFRGKKNHRQ